MLFVLNGDVDLIMMGVVSFTHFKSNGILLYIEVLFSAALLYMQSMVYV